MFTNPLPSTGRTGVPVAAPNGPYTRIANAYTLTTTGEPKSRIRVKELII